MIGLTHYIPITLSGTSPAMVVAFELDRCECCGRPVEAPNAIKIDARSAVMHLRPWRKARLPEVYYDEDFDGTRCYRDDCEEVSRE